MQTEIMTPKDIAQHIGRGVQWTLGKVAQALPKPPDATYREEAKRVAEEQDRVRAELLSIESGVVSREK